MPLYEYQCDSCGAQFELIRKFSDPPLQVCPTCGAENVRKLVSSPAFQFKGSGWYVTDYAKKSGSGESGAATKASAEARADAKSDAKGERKAESSKDTATPVADKASTSTEKPGAPATPAAPAKDK